VSLRRLGLAATLPLVIVVFAGGAVLAAGGFEVTTFLEPRTGLTDTQPFQFVIQISGEASAQRVVPPEFFGVEGLAVVGGPDTHNRFYWANGRSNSSYQVSRRPERTRFPLLN
jgi:hypothetical protein